MTPTARRACLILVLACTCVQAALAAPPASAQLSVATAHRLGISSLVWSADGKLLLSTSADNTARLWEVATGAMLRLFSAPSTVVRGLGNDLRAGAFVDAARQVVIAGADGTRLWNVADGTLLATLDPPSHMVSALAASDASGMVITTGHGEPAEGARLFLRVHALASGTVRQLDVSALGSIAALALSADGSKLALAGALITRRTPGSIETVPIVRVLDLQDGRVLDEVRGAQGFASWVQFDGAARLAYQIDNSVYLRESAGGPTMSVPGLSAGLSPDGTLLALAPHEIDPPRPGGAHLAVELYSVVNTQRLATIPIPGAPHRQSRSRVLRIAFGPDGRQLALGFNDGAIALLDHASGAYNRHWPGRPFGPRRLQLTDRAGTRALLPTPNGMALWDLDKGRRLALDVGPEADVLAVSPDGQRVFAGAAARWEVWDSASGRQLWRAPGSINRVQVAQFHPQSDLLATANWSQVLYWSASKGALLQTRATGFSGVAALSFSADGAWLAVGDELGDVRILPTLKGAARASIGAPGVSATVTGLVFNHDGTQLAVTYGNGYNRTLIYDAATGALLRPAGGHAAAIHALAVDAGGKLLATGGEDHAVRLWDWGTGKQLATLFHSGEVLALGLSADARHLFTYADYSLRLWDLSDPAKPLALLHFSELPYRRWAVADGAGRFDTGDLEMGEAMHWLMSDQPLRGLRPEIFMRDYFEPRLAARLLACRNASGADACSKTFSLLAPVTSLNRVQPRVDIVAVTRPTPDGPAQVTVAVTAMHDPTQPVGKTDSGAYDLRLFRDGQLVQRWPQGTASSGASDLPAVWRPRAIIAMAPGQRRFEQTFSVDLPTPAAARTVEFSAYAFNHDRVKSITARDSSLTLAPKPGRPRPKAFVVSVGVNGYTAASRNLRFAVNDATAMSRALSKLEGFEVVTVLLTSEPDPASWRATKASIREALARLAGQGATPGTLARVAGAARLRKAGPDDLVLFSFSGHGHTARDGSFYLLASDSGPAEATISPASLATFISSEDLSHWFGPIDAGQLAIVIDACHAGASVEQAGFKPGPMGDRGLGQLAYDKGMLILAASQADDVAIESGQLKQGLLTYALTHDGLRRVSRHAPSLRADHNANGELTLREWLAYGEQRTPALYAEVRDKRRHVDYVGKDPDPGPDFRASVFRRAQTPALFDFSRGRLGAVMARHVAAPLPLGVTPLPPKIERNWVPYPEPSPMR